MSEPDFAKKKLETVQLHIASLELLVDLQKDQIAHLEKMNNLLNKSNQENWAKLIFLHDKTDYVLYTCLSIAIFCIFLFNKEVAAWMTGAFCYLFAKEIMLLVKKVFPKKQKDI